MQKILTHPTEWDPKTAKVTLNVCTEACIVPTGETAARLSYGHVVVLDDFFGEEERKRLFEMVNGSKWTETQQNPNPDNWERATCDQVGQIPSWGLKVRKRLG